MRKDTGGVGLIILIAGLFGVLPLAALFVLYVAAGDVLEGDFTPFIAFSAVTAALLIGAVIAANKAAARKNLSKYGAGAKARLIAVEGGLYLSGVPYYRVRYEFVNSHGQTAVRKSPYLFDALEAEYLRTLSEIDIKYDGEKSVAVCDVSAAKLKLPGCEDGENAR